MELTFAKAGKTDMLFVDDAKILFPNFEGREDTYNREGDRNFHLSIPTEEMADELIAQGWNVQVKEYDDGEKSFKLKVKVKFNGRGPAVYLVTGNKVNELDEDTVHRLDKIDIQTANMDIRAYDWEMATGKCGRTAYLQRIEVIQELDRFKARYAEEEYPVE